MVLVSCIPVFLLELSAFYIIYQ